MSKYQKRIVKKWLDVLSRTSAPMTLVVFFSFRPSRLSPVLFFFLFLLPGFFFLTGCDPAGEDWTALRNIPGIDGSTVIANYDLQFEHRETFGGGRMILQQCR
jgi:hypothetical protein